MEYRDFMENVKNDLPDYLGGTLKDALIEETSVSKLQGRSYDGISVRLEDSQMGIVMDMQPFFQMLESGVPYESVLEQIADTALEGNEKRPDVSLVTNGNYEEMKEHLTVQLIGREGNEEILDQIPHRDMEDMAVIYRVEFQRSDLESASTVVTNSMLMQYGVTVDQIHQDAITAATAHHPYAI